MSPIYFSVFFWLLLFGCMYVCMYVCMYAWMNVYVLFLCAIMYEWMSVCVCMVECNSAHYTTMRRSCWLIVCLTSFWFSYGPLVSGDNTWDVCSSGGDVCSGRGGCGCCGSCCIASMSAWKVAINLTDIVYVCIL